MDFIKELELTMYEFLGYLSPGLVSAAGVWLCAASVEDRVAAAPDCHDWVIVAAVLFVGYIFGHLTQSLGNVLEKWCKVPEKSLKEVPASTMQAARGVLARILPGQDLADRDVQRLCDAYLVQHGRTALRDVYLYREGFYRGLTIAFPILALGVLAVDVHWPFSGAAFNQAVMVGGILILLGAARLSYSRYFRFSVYRRAIGVEGAVALWAAEQTKAAAPKGT